MSTPSQEVKLVFLDLETTGLEIAACEVIECAYTCFTGKESESLCSLFDTKTAIIPPEVSGVTNIDTFDVKGKPLFTNSEIYNKLKKFAELGYVAVCHNTDFDLRVLKQYGIFFQKEICTMYLSKYLFKQLKNHKLGTMRAFFEIPHSGEAHRADYDVQILIKVARVLFAHLKVSQEEVVSKAIEMTKTAKIEIQSRWRFGKYKGQRINFLHQSKYIDWILQNSKNLDYRLKTYLETGETEAFLS